jgi:hypothetical protein
MVVYKFTASVFFIFAVTRCVAQSYTIRGHIKGVDTGWAYIRHRQQTGTDSGKIVSGNFIITGKVGNPEFCAFGLSINRRKDYYLGLFLESGNLTFRVDTDSLNDIGIIVKGSSVELQFQQFQAMVAGVNKLHLTESALMEKLEQISSKYALEHRSSYISAFAIFWYEKNLDKLSKLFIYLTPNVRKSYFGQKIAENLNSR